MLRALLVILLFSGVVLGGAAAWFLHAVHQPLSVSVPDYLLVERGDSAGSVAATLADRLPTPTLLFRIYVRLTSSRGHIKAGEYVISPGMTSVDLLADMRNGRVVQRQITFPEGWTTMQWIAELGRTSLLTGQSKGELLEAIVDPRDWEGRLYPDTYAYTRAEPALSILNRARRKMDIVLDEIWQNRSGSGEVSSKAEALVLASMIEKETGYEPDRALIASVFNNRLARGMKLQSDPTVIYGIEDFDGDLKRRHLRLEHPYNTYQIPGLPAGPICNPGRASIEAAVNPPPGPHLYFVAQGDGRSYFSTSLQEHNRAVNQYQKAGRVERYRSTPDAAVDPTSQATESAKPN